MARVYSLTGTAVACFLSAAGIAAFHGSSGWFWACIGMAAVLTVAALVAYVRARRQAAKDAEQALKREESEQRQRAADRLRARPIQRGGDPQSWADQALVNKPMNDLIRKSIADANTDDDLEDIPDPWAGLKRTLAVASGRKRTKRPK
jgi:heme exporter protein D